MVVTILKMGVLPIKLPLNQSNETMIIPYIIFHNYENPIEISGIFSLVKSRGNLTSNEHRHQ